MIACNLTKIKKLEKIAMIIDIYQLLGCNLSIFFTNISQTERLEVNSGRLVNHFVKGAIKMALTKAQIVEKIAEQNGFPKNRSSKIVENLLEVIKHTFVLGEDVLITGFGKFCVKEKGGATG